MRQSTRTGTGKGSGTHHSRRCRGPLLCRSRSVFFFLACSSPILLLCARPPVPSSLPTPHARARACVAMGRPARRVAGRALNVTLLGCLAVAATLAVLPHGAAAQGGVEVDGAAVGDEGLGEELVTTDDGGGHGGGGGGGDAGVGHGVDATPDPKVAMDAALDTLNLDSLNAIERQLRAENLVADKTIATLRSRSEKLSAERHAAEVEARRLERGRDWELRQKEKREEELRVAQSDLADKEQKKARMVRHIEDLREEVARLTAQLEAVRKENERTEAQYAHPSIYDVLDARTEELGPLPHAVFNRTVHALLPPLERELQSALYFRGRMAHTNALTSITVSLTVYAFIVTAGSLLVDLIKRLRGRLSVARLVLAGDVFFAGLWALLAAWYAVLLRDPLPLMRERAEAVFIIFQLVVLMAFATVVLFRLLLATDARLSSAGEAFSVVVVGQHAYMKVWAPIWTEDELPSCVFLYYVTYACLFASFAYSRSSVEAEASAAADKAADLDGQFMHGRAAAGQPPLPASSVKVLMEEGEDQREDAVYQGSEQSLTDGSDEEVDEAAVLVAERDRPGRTWARHPAYQARQSTSRRRGGVFAPLARW